YIRWRNVVIGRLLPWIKTRSACGDSPTRPTEEVLLRRKRAMTSAAQGKEENSAGRVSTAERFSSRYVKGLILFVKPFSFSSWPYTMPRNPPVLRSLASMPSHTWLAALHGVPVEVLVR